MPRSEKAEREEDWASFDAALQRPLRERIARGCLHTFKPVLDEGPGVRVWDTMEDYRRWCEENLPEWLGYRKVSDREWQELMDDASKSAPPVDEATVAIVTTAGVRHPVE